MAKATDKGDKGDKGLAKRVANLEKEVKAMTKEGPPRPEDRVASAGERPDYLKVTQGNADYAGPVGRDMARLQGRSRNDLVPDHERGAASPIGHGTGSKRTRR